MKTEKKIGLCSAALHIAAMGFMLCDHLWAMLLTDWKWLTWIGRLAFPIFAFLLVEGYFHTRNLKRYMLRLLLLAVLTEIPFNLMYADSLIYPFHQNVIWTLLLGLWLISRIEKAKQSNRKWRWILTSALAVILGYLIGMITMIDYNGGGVLMLLAFYFFRGRKWWNYVGQAVSMYYINTELLGSLYYPVQICGMEFELVEQSLALLALIPIWLYNGQQGFHGKAFRIVCYVFYPLHMLVLYWISVALFR